MIPDKAAVLYCIWAFSTQAVHGCNECSGYLDADWA